MYKIPFPLNNIPRQRGIDNKFDTEIYIRMPGKYMDVANWGESVSLVENSLLQIKISFYW